MNVAGVYIITRSSVSALTWLMRGGATALTSHDWNILPHDTVNLLPDAGETAQLRLWSDKITHNSRIRAARAQYAVFSTQCLVRAFYRFSWRTSIRETWWRNGVLQVSAGLYWWVSLYNSAKLAIKHHKLASTRQSVIDVKLSFARVSSRLWLTDSGSSVWLN